MAAAYPVYSPQQQNFILQFCNFVIQNNNLTRREELHTCKIESTVSNNDDDDDDKKNKKNVIHVASGGSKGFRLYPAQKMSIHTKCSESHLSPVIHTKHAGRHGFQGN